MGECERLRYTEYITLLPLSELLEDDAVGEALSANTDTLQHTITPQLIQNKVGVQFTSLEKERFADEQPAKTCCSAKKLWALLHINCPELIKLPRLRWVLSHMINSFQNVNTFSERRSYHKRQCFAISFCWLM